MRRITRSAARLAASAMAAAALLAACNNPQSPNAVLSQLEANAVAEEITHRRSGARAGRHVQFGFRRAVRGRPNDGSSRDADDVGQLHANDNACLTRELRRRSRARFRAGRLHRLHRDQRIVHGDARRHDRLRRSQPPLTTYPLVALPRPTGAPTSHTDFSRSVTNSVTGKTRSVVENGVRMVTGSADQLQFTETDFRTDYTFATGATASHVRTWSSTFTADQAGAIQAGSPLPSGNWNIAGSSTWTSGLLSYSLAVTTTPQPALQRRLHARAALRFRHARGGGYEKTARRRM